MACLRAGRPAPAVPPRHRGDGLEGGGGVVLLSGLEPNGVAEGALGRKQTPAQRLGISQSRVWSAGAGQHRALRRGGRGPQDLRPNGRGGAHSPEPTHPAQPAAGVRKSDAASAGAVRASVRGIPEPESARRRAAPTRGGSCAAPGGREARRRAGAGSARSSSSSGRVVRPVAPRRAAPPRPAPVV